MQMSDVARLFRAGEGGTGLRVVFVSVDPQRDTPTVLGMYVHAFDPRFQGLTGAPAAIGLSSGVFAATAVPLMFVWRMADRAPAPASAPR